MDDLIFNELSLSPYPDSFPTLHQKVKDLVLLCKEGREKFGFNKLRFETHLHELHLMENYSLQDFVSDERVSRNIKDLLLGLRRYPYIADEDEDAADEYIKNTFTYKDQPCEGLAAAYIYKTLATSILSDEIWNVTKINLDIQDENNHQINDFVYHISKPEHIESENIKEWHQNKYIGDISSLEDLQRLYPNYLFEQQAFDDLMYWKNHDKNLYIKLHKLLQDIIINPFSGGLGKTEVLKSTEGQAAKRLDQEHRIVYILTGGGENKMITIYQCKGHYEDK